MSYEKKIVYFPLSFKDGIDLIMCQCGIQSCEPNYQFGPAVRDHYLIHYVLEGSGTYYLNNNRYSISKNNGFLICPDVPTYYKADSENPWVYAWIGFKGLKAKEYLKLANLDINNATFNYANENFMIKLFEDIRGAINLKYAQELRLQGLLDIFLSALIENAEHGYIHGFNYNERYIKKALNYIENNYSQHFNITDIAEYVGLSSNYFGALFKKAIGVTIQDYLIHYRIDRSCELMKNEQLAIGVISRSVGYVDPLTFSKTFKKIKGISPRKFRQT